MILFGLAVALAVASLFVQWGAITIATSEDLRESITINGENASGDAMGEIFGSMMSSMLSGMRVPVSGLNGNFVLGRITIPYWLSIVAAIAGILFTITNSRKLSEIPSKLILALLLSGIVAGIWAVIALLMSGSVSIGAFLLIGASIIGLTQQKPAITDFSISKK